MGMPTDKLLRMVESNETRMHLVASASVVVGVMTRSMIGFPYLASPVCRNGVSVSGFDEVALGVDAKQPRRLAFELSTDDERGVERNGTAFQEGRVATLDVAHGIRNEDCHVEHGARSPQVGRSIRDLAALLQHADHGLRPGQVAGAQQDEHAIAGPLEHGHFAELGEVIHAGVRARVRREDDPILEQDADTVRHA